MMTLKSISSMRALNNNRSGDDFLCFRQLRLLAAEQNNTEFGEAGWYKEQFEVCDTDNDGLLNVTEFNEYVP